MLCHEIVPEKAVALFEDGLLQISAPLKEQVKGLKVEVEYLKRGYVYAV